MYINSMNLVLIAHNIRSVHNVGSIMRTCEGLGVDRLYLTGYTPYPELDKDSRLPHISQKMTREIEKTALGADKTLDWEQSDDIFQVIDQLKVGGYEIVALEQTPTAIELAVFMPAANTALIIGREVEGSEPEVLEKADKSVHIPMARAKESFNVAVAASIALYQLKHKADGLFT
jgi:23S rRNA (guanosine2251-2'-O)-methyltransferase